MKSVKQRNKCCKHTKRGFSKLITNHLDGISDRNENAQFLLMIIKLRKR